MIKKKNIRQIIPIIVMLIVVFILNNNEVKDSNKQQKNLESLYKSKAYGILITIEAQVEKVLKDDTVGDRHQKMILRVGKNTVLLAHNIDVATRVPIKENDTIIVKGEYEWNQKGGVIHWTHKKNNNSYGWIMHKNKKYQ